MVFSKPTEGSNMGLVLFGTWKQLDTLQMVIFTGNLMIETQNLGQVVCVYCTFEWSLVLLTMYLGKKKKLIWLKAIGGDFPY